MRAMLFSSLLLLAFFPVARANAGEPDLIDRIHAMNQDVRDVPLPLIIKAVSGTKVIPWEGQDRETLRDVARLVYSSFNADHVTARRVNEVGNKVEDYVLEALRREGFEAGRPVDRFGHARAAGYPDIEASREGKPFYIEVKVFSASTEDSTQRSFYLSPSAEFKVTHDAHHLLIAVEVTHQEDGYYRAESVRWLDLSRLRCDLKYEFNASNRDLYSSEAGLVIIEDEPNSN